MPRFSQESFSKLTTCHMDLQALFFEVVKTFDCSVLEGYRNQEDQERAHEAGNTQLHYPFGKHNKQPSMAVDVAPHPLDWKETRKFFLFAGYVLGVADQLKSQGKMTHAIRWGGAWNGELNGDNMLNDYVHFELVV